MFHCIRLLGVSFLFSSVLLLLGGCSSGDTSSSSASTPTAGDSGYASDSGGYGYDGGSDGYGGYDSYDSGDSSSAASDEVEQETSYDDEEAEEESEGSADSSQASYGYADNPTTSYGYDDNPGDGYGQSDYAAAAEAAYRRGEPPPPAPTTGGRDQRPEFDDAYASSDGYGTGGGVDYRAQIEPIFRTHCYRCHGGGPRATKGGFDLSSEQAVADSGMVVAGEPGESDLLRRVTLQEGDKEVMPPKGPGLSPDEIELVRMWIQSGARFDAGYDDAYASSDGYGGYADGYGAPAGRDVQAPAPPRTLADMASRQFLGGKDVSAMKYLFAQSLVNSSDGGAVLEKYRWVSGLKRPVLAVRWGIGVQFSKKGNWTTGPKPIGVEQSIPQGRRRGDSDSSSGGNAGGGFSSLESPYSEFKNTALDYYTGRLGSTLIDRLHMRIERSYYGDILKAELESAATGDRDRFDDEDSRADTSDSYGYSAPTSGGDSYGYGAPPRGGRQGGFDGGGNDDEAPADRIEQIMPGVTMLGVASQGELFKRAREQGVDALVIYDVKVERNIPARLIYNSTRMRFYDATTQKQLAVTKSLHNVNMQKLLEKDPEDDSINLEIDKIFAVADKAYRCVDFPSQIKSEHVLGRVKRILAQHDDNPLQKLSEVRFYRSRDLLTDEQLAAAYTKITPEKAVGLAGAADDDAVQGAVGPWLVDDSAAVVSSEDPQDQDEDHEEEDNGGRRRNAFR